MVNIAVISDIRIYCEGLDHVLSGTQSVNVVGSVSSGEAALKLVSDYLPDVVLLDMTMASSCELAQRISSISAATKVVALAVPCNERNILQCAEAGITCYVLREASITELVEAVMCAAKGKCYCPQEIISYVFRKIQNGSPISGSPMAPSPVAKTHGAAVHTPPLQERLTRRERQIATLLTDGMSNKQIAKNLSIEVSTVKNHVHNVLVKLDARSRSQAVSILQRLSTHLPCGSSDLDPCFKELV